MSADSPTTLPSLSTVGDMPTIHEDELLYSIVARYGWTTGYIHAEAANLDLFGRTFGHSASRMPMNLDAMARRLPASLGLTGRDLALKHTLLPYHCAFMAHADKEQAIATALADGDRQGRRIGSFQQPLPPPVQLRFCPECIANSISAGHDPHWKRLHQLAIVVICPEHRCDLRKSAVAPKPDDRRLRRASSETCPPDSDPVIPDGASVDRTALLQLAERAKILLNEGYPAGITRESGPKYAQALRDLGYARGRHLHWEKIVPNLPSAIAGLVPALPGIATINGDAMGWFATSMAPNRPVHPDRILIAAMVVDQIDGLARRFWTAFDASTGRPLMELPDVA